MRGTTSSRSHRSIKTLQLCIPVSHHPPDNHDWARTVYRCRSLVAQTPFLWDISTSTPIYRAELDISLITVARLEDKYNFNTKESATKALKFTGALDKRGLPEIIVSTLLVLPTISAFCSIRLTNTFTDKSSRQSRHRHRYSKKGKQRINLRYDHIILTTRNSHQSQWRNFNFEGCAFYRNSSLLALGLMPFYC